MNAGNAPIGDQGTGENLLVTGIGQLVTGETGPSAVVMNASVLIEGGRVVFAGATSELDSDRIVGVPTLSAQGRLVTPGLVDCHTHLVFAGHRADEFEMRTQGVSYEEIARRGGGIRKTVLATRSADVAELVRIGAPRVAHMLAQGVTTLEIKSGYGLSLESEIKILESIRALAGLTPTTIVSTFLGAHTIMPEDLSDRARYVRGIAEDWIPAVASSGLARFCDVFCETVAFTVDESRLILESGKRHGLVPRVHADQLHRTGGCKLAVEVGATSADHCDHAGEDDLRAMARAGTVAVLFPGCPISMGTFAYPSARRFLSAGVEVAISTDFNPGSSTTSNLPLMGTLAMAYMGMNALEVWRSMTYSAAKALGMASEIGLLAPGYAGDLVIHTATDPVEPFYHYGQNTADVVVKRGRVVIGGTTI